MATLSPAATGHLRALVWVPAASNGGTDLLVAGGEDQKLRVWQLSGTQPTLTGTHINTLGSIHGTVWSLKWIAAHSVLASGSGDGFIRLWPLSALNNVQACHVEAKGNGNDLCCDGDGLGCEGARVVSWRDAQMTRAGQVHALEWIGAHSLLASAWSDGVVRLWTYSSTNSPPLTYNHSIYPTGRAYSLTWLTGLEKLAVTSPDWTLPELWDKDGAQQKMVLTEHLPTGFGCCPTAHCGPVHASVADGAGTMLATASDDAKVKLWAADSGAMNHTFSGHAAAVTALEWMHSESKLVSGGADGSILLWDPTNLGAAGPASSTLSAHNGRVSSLAWMSTLGALASASHDLTVKLWHCV